MDDQLFLVVPIYDGSGRTVKVSLPLDQDTLPAEVAERYEVRHGILHPKAKAAANESLISPPSG
jgi:hypothetical protein